MNETKTLAEKIRELGDNGQYNEQAETFLKECGVLYEARKAVPQLSPDWAQDGKHGIHWSITLAKLATPLIDEMRGHIETKCTFSFWDSIANKEKAEHSAIGSRKPRAYDVLASLYTPVESFEDFCAEFGYSEDSRTAERIYNEILALNKKLAKVFTPEQLEAMQEIN